MTRIILCLMVAGCISYSAPTSRELINARVEYSRATRSNAATDAPAALASARETLEHAERVHAAAPASRRERELAFMALRRSQAAIAEGNARAAHRAAEAARNELAREAESAKQEAETTRLTLEQTEAQLAEVRRQLAAQGTTMNEETQALKQREAALQAQLDAMRTERDAAVTKMRELGDVAEQEDKSLVLTVPSEVMFRTDEAILLPTAKQKLDALAQALLSLGSDQTFVIEGHTDSTGSDEYNQRLSQARALAVRAYLIDRGIDADNIRAAGRGEDEPVAANANPEGRANNRRVEIVVTPPTVSRR